MNLVQRQRIAVRRVCMIARLIQETNCPIVAFRLNRLWEKGFRRLVKLAMRCG